MAPRLGIGEGEALVQQRLGRSDGAGRRRRGGHDGAGGRRRGGEGGDVADGADAARSADGDGAESDCDGERGAVVTHLESRAARHCDANGGIEIVLETKKVSHDAHRV